MLRSATPQPNNKTAKIKAVHWLRFMLCPLPCTSAKRQLLLHPGSGSAYTFRVISLLDRTLSRDGVGVTRRGWAVARFQDHKKKEYKRAADAGQGPASETNEREPKTVARFVFCRNRAKFGQRSTSGQTSRWLLRRVRPNVFKSLASDSLV